MRRIVCGLAVLGCLLTLSPAGAGVSTTTGIARQAGAGFYLFDPETMSEHQGYVTVLTVIGETSDGVSATPVTDFLATGSERNCTESGCVFYDFPSQIVSPSALDMDVLGNTAEFQACLIPTSGPPCRQFNLSWTQPAGLTPTYCSPFIVCLNANAWFDPGTSEAAAEIMGAIGVIRYGYRITGTFNGNPFPNYPGAGGTTQQTLAASASASVP